MTERMKLTRERIRRIEPPAKGEKTVWDTEVHGLGIRCLASGVKSYIVSYSAGLRTGKGRGTGPAPRRITLDKVGAVRLEDAREAAMDIRGRVMKGADPVVERRAQRLQERREMVTLGVALDRYDADQQRRNVSDKRNVQSTLRRHLLGHIGDVPLADLDRRSVVEAIEALEVRGLPGAAKSLRGHASTFLRWCADRGLIPVNPLQGYRAQRATRAERIAQPGRILSDDEIARVWVACGAERVNPSFGAFVQFTILTGQRRSETAAMCWHDLDTASEWWTIPAEQTKNGLAHEVPLPPLAQGILAARPRFEGCDVVFTTNGVGPLAGWSKLMPKLRDAAGLAENWTLHDLRRTFRSGLTKLGIETDLAEIMLNHRPETLRSVYDREPRLGDRRTAAERWANHVAGVVSPEGRQNVVKIGGGV